MHLLHCDKRMCVVCILSLSTLLSLFLWRASSLALACLLACVSEFTRWPSVSLSLILSRGHFLLRARVLSLSLAPPSPSSSSLLFPSRSLALSLVLVLFLVLVLTRCRSRSHY